MINSNSGSSGYLNKTDKKRFEEWRAQGYQALSQAGGTPQVPFFFQTVQRTFFSVDGLTEITCNKVQLSTLLKTTDIDMSEYQTIPSYQYDNPGAASILTVQLNRYFAISAIELDACYNDLKSTIIKDITQNVADQKVTFISQTNRFDFDPPIYTSQLKLDFSSNRYSIKPLIKKIFVESIPATPRFGLAIDGEFDNISWFDTIAGRVGIENEIPDTAIDNSQKFSDALTQFINHWLSSKKPTDTKLIWNLIIASDTPCVYRASVSYQINGSVKCLPDNQEKVVCKFEDSSLEPRVISFLVPKKIAVNKFSLTINEDISGKAAKCASYTLLPGAPLQGINIAECSAAQILDLQGIEFFAGIAVHIFNCAVSSTLTLSIFVDNNGSPDGKKIWSGSQLLHDTPWSGWVPFLFDTPLLLGECKVWSVLSIDSGSALWLCDPGSGINRIEHDKKGMIISSEKSTSLAGRSVLIHPLTSGNEPRYSAQLSKVTINAPIWTEKTRQWIHTDTFSRCGIILESDNAVITVTFKPMFNCSLIVNPMILNCTLCEK